MKKHIVKCRFCKENFDTSELEEGVDWIMPSNKFYYHLECYTQLLSAKNDIKKTIGDDLWYDVVKDYLYKDLKIDVDFAKLDSQWNSFTKNGKTPKGIYFALKYYYGHLHNDPSKANGGIGIIPYIYEDGCRYWIERERIEHGICEKLEQQVMAKQTNIKTISIKPNKKAGKKIMSLAEISDEEGE